MDPRAALANAIEIMSNMDMKGFKGSQAMQFALTVETLKSLHNQLAAAQTLPAPPAVGLGAAS